MSGYVDAHAHLTDPRFSDVDAVIDRAHEAAVLGILTCGEDMASSARAIALAERHALVSVAVGIHPHRAVECDRVAVDGLRQLAQHPAVVAIGEIGLDFSGRSAPREAQVRALVEQLELAMELRLPVVLHVRDSGRELRQLLLRHPAARGQVHCYSEGPDEVDEWIAHGFHLSFAGTLTFPNARRLREAARRVPVERLLFETDAPYLAPVPHRGKRNEPAFVAATVAAAARERGESQDELAARSVDNARKLFGARLAPSS